MNTTEPNARNLKLTLSFHGEGYAGYQRQPHVKTVQEVLERAWNILTQESPVFYACSRLDAGVSANHFVLNFRTPTTFDNEKILRALNGILHTNLEAKIAIYRVETVPEAFHSRFDAVGKHYRYLIWYGYGFHANYLEHAWGVRSREEPKGLADVMRDYEGEHDFSAFRAQDCAAKRTVRTIHRADVWQHPTLPELFVADFWGDGFLKHMIRNVVGTAVDIATQKLPRSAIAEAFEHKERVQMGQCAPARALRLEKVYYDADEFKKDAARGARHLIPC